MPNWHFRNQIFQCFILIDNENAKFLIKLATLHRKEYENICTNMFVRYQQCKIFYKTPFCREHYDISETPSSKKGQIHLPFKV